MKVVVKAVGVKPEARDVKGFKGFQEIVGGDVEAVTIENGIVMLVNEEGKLEGLPYNFTMSGDTIVGDVVFVGAKGSEFVSLRSDQIEYVLKRFTK